MLLAEWSINWRLRSQTRNQEYHEYLFTFAAFLIVVPAVGGLDFVFPRRDSADGVPGGERLFYLVPPGNDRLVVDGIVLPCRICANENSSSMAASGDLSYPAGLRCFVRLHAELRATSMGRAG